MAMAMAVDVNASVNNNGNAMVLVNDWVSMPLHCGNTTKSQISPLSFVASATPPTRQFYPATQVLQRAASGIQRQHKRHKYFVKEKKILFCVLCGLEKKCDPVLLQSHDAHRWKRIVKGGFFYLKVEIVTGCFS
ncbi:hypothetical protein CEXT_385691 [Caerostris extrusa]|uniref:Uncharacterized protein n=1 Tax=Caerostris extrusa TaxID=172846 RepID=A0AAV4S528_CAEEX|nr:hypothetical protein CEXT_385691 [Caerostris extrusa]